MSRSVAASRGGGDGSITVGAKLATWKQYRGVGGGLGGVGMSRSIAASWGGGGGGTRAKLATWK